MAEYIERLPTAFEPYGGRYLVHATQHEVKEGDWPGHVVMIGFPGIAEARAWCDSVGGVEEHRPVRPAGRRGWLRDGMSQCRSR
ncbi:DUF1330 domain-containing protein [Microtetraspora malaysiensis]|uniref:DUF1330 domain-containing protein n=1 Tax=Microtetraspora malaysiensis TaxID=161358 RepID=A0ABW6T0M4_9ACTN